MAVSYTEALSAYRQAVQQAQQLGPGQQNAPEQGVQEAGTPNFGEVLRQESKEAINTLEKGEKQSLAAAAGEANINDVVMAMSKAEMTLQTVTTIRDKAVDAYKQIMRMPI
jgi:flagellar hook-basal body complex protein FliE